MKNLLIENFLDSIFSAKTNEPYITWRQYFKQMCLGHLPLLQTQHPREDWYTLDEITREQYPEFFMIQDLCFIEPMIETVGGKPFFEIVEPTEKDFQKKEINWELATATLNKVVDYLFNEGAHGESDQKED